MTSINIVPFWTPTLLAGHFSSLAASLAAQFPSLAAPFPSLAAQFPSLPAQSEGALFWGDLGVKKVENLGFGG